MIPCKTYPVEVATAAIFQQIPNQNLLTISINHHLEIKMCTEFILSTLIILYPYYVPIVIYQLCFIIFKITTSHGPRHQCGICYENLLITPTNYGIGIYTVYLLSIHNTIHHNNALLHATIKLFQFISVLNQSLACVINELMKNNFKF